ncbi:hypothetical protein [Bacillus sp. FJAT-27251]|uniref:glucosamine inositolphosphorylceramide transferase family protein n=1 Tax=Bacillus sp. FJAT-27251 TaxID=1684142 RepID=UPI0006A76636|nr:hypothetical protein [Bacillus sp. FJAT-27251]
MKKPQLRYALISDTDTVEDWQHEAIVKLSGLDETVCCAVIQFSGKKKQTKFRFGKTRPITSFYDESLMRIECGEATDKDYVFSKEDINLINHLELDFILCLSSRQISGEIVILPKHGVWRFNQRFLHPDSGKNNIHGVPVIAASLEKVLPNNQHIILKQGYFSTFNSSHLKSQRLVRMASAPWPALVCRDILNDNASYLYNIPSVDKGAEKGENRKVSFSLKWIEDKLRSIYNKLFCYEYWNVGIVHRPIHHFLNDDEERLDIEWIVERKDMYLADPFVYKIGDKFQIIMEELNHKVVKGFISEATVPQNGSGESAFRQATISTASHMSYPYILEYRGEIYCVPETSERMEVPIYKLNQENGNWQKVKALIKDFPAIDSTIIKYQDLWWLFCTKANSTFQSHNNELYIFYSRNLMGEWKPHALNPVKVDVRSSRPAGTPFIYEERLYRPSQDCSKTYGGRISLNKIKKLTPSEFEEETIKYIEPNKDSLYPDGVHTITSAGDVTVLDGKRFDYHWSHFFRKLYKLKPTNLQKIRTRTYEINNRLLKTNKTPATSNK